MNRTAEAYPKLNKLPIRVLKLYRPELLATFASDPNEVASKNPSSPK
jgi:hypothetical protein